MLLGGFKKADMIIALLKEDAPGCYPQALLLSEALVDPTGFEPVTSALQKRRSTN